MHSDNLYRPSRRPLNDWTLQPLPAIPTSPVLDLDQCLQKADLLRRPDRMVSATWPSFRDIHNLTQINWFLLSFSTSILHSNEHCSSSDSSNHQLGLLLLALTSASSCLSNCTLHLSPCYGPSNNFLYPQDWSFNGITDCFYHSS